jgi:hypothetical protein
MQVRKLETARARDVRQFINFSYDLYRECPQWVPPVLPEIRLMLNRDKHPFYRHSIADFFVVESGGQTLARIAVMDNRNYNEYHGRKDSFFYFFECVEDVDVAPRDSCRAMEWAY